MDAEEKADRAANEIVDLVEQEVQLKPTMAANHSSYEIMFSRRTFSDKELSYLTKPINEGIRNDLYSIKR
jgi:hypothetical protein